jgi:hypothetical protein
MSRDVLNLEEAQKVLLDWAAGVGVEAEAAGPYHWAVTLPGTHKLKTTVSVKMSERGADVQAFVIRHPDENEAKFHSWLLHRNGRLQACSFFVDSLGDVYLRAHVPAAAWSQEWIDALMGQVLSAADESFDELLVLGFLTSMKREWAWRVARGESTRNLAAFAHLLDGEDNEFLGTF